MYKVTVQTLQGNEYNLYYPGDNQFVFTNAVLTYDIGLAGEFNFSIPYTNPSYDQIAQNSIITIYKDGVEYWRGDIRQITTRFDKSLDVYCIEDLSWLGDEPLIMAQVTNQTNAQRLSNIIASYNLNQVEKRQFTAGMITNVSSSALCTWSPEYGMNALTGLRQFIAQSSGYLRVRRVTANGTVTRYIDIVRLSDYGVQSNQRIEFGSNLLDYTKEFDATNITNALYPYGKETETPLYGETMQRIAGTAIQNDDSISAFGRRAKTVVFDTDNLSTLNNLAAAYLSRYSQPHIELQITAVDLGSISNVNEYSIGDSVRVVAAIYGIDQLLYITHLELDLLDPANNQIKLSDTVRTASLTSQVATQADEIKDIRTPASVLDEAKRNAWAILEGDNGGIVTFEINGQEQIVGIHIANNLDLSQATKAWGWTLNGLVYMHRDYPSDDWEIGIAMTMDGQIVADYITTGEMSADRINGGHIRTNLITALDSDTTIDGKTVFEIATEQANTVSHYGENYAKDTATLLKIVNGTVTEGHAQYAIRSALTRHSNYGAITIRCSFKMKRTGVRNAAGNPYLSMRINVTGVYQGQTSTQNVGKRFTGAVTEDDADFMQYADSIPILTVMDSVTTINHFRFMDFSTTQGTIEIKELKVEISDTYTTWSMDEDDIINAFADIQDQLDGKVETWYQSTDPSTAWTTAELRDSHIGDLWYNTTDNTTWRYSGTQWVQQNVPTSVFDRIDGKAQVYITTPTTPYFVGDLWFNSSTSDILTCVTARSTGSYVSSDWVKRNKYTDDTAVTNLNNALTQDEIMNRLTNNLQTEGIYLQGGHVYINGSRLAVGKITDRYNYNYWDLDNGEMRISALAKVYDSEADYSGAYIPTNSNAPASSWTDDGLKRAHIGATFLNTSTNVTYIYDASSMPESLHPYNANTNVYYKILTGISGSIKLHFNSQSQTENSYDYINLYYLNGSTYYYRQLTGNIANLDVVIPSGTFWLYWHSDSSVQNWGWKVDSVTATSDSSTGFTSSSLPSATWTEINIGTPTWREASIQDYAQVDLDQESVFNALTNNGQAQGLYLQNGNLYVSASYIGTGEMSASRIKGGTLTLGGSSNVNGILEVKDAGGIATFTANKDGVIATQLTVTGNSTFGNFKIGDKTIHPYGSDLPVKYIYADGYKEYYYKKHSGVLSKSYVTYIYVNPAADGWTANADLNISFYANETSTSSHTSTQLLRVSKQTWNGTKWTTSEYRRFNVYGDEINGKDNYFTGFYSSDTTTYRFVIKVSRATWAEDYEIDFFSDQQHVLEIDPYTITGSFNGQVSGSASFTNFSLQGFDYSEEIGDFYGHDASIIVDDDTDDNGSYTYRSKISYNDIRVENSSGVNYAWMAYNEFRVGASAYASLTGSRLYIYGTSSNTMTLSTSNLTRVLGGTTYNPTWSTSDERVKEEIESLSPKLSRALIDASEPKKFKYKGADGKHYGMIAQDVRPLLDSLGEEDSQLEHSMDIPEDVAVVEDQRMIDYQEYIPHLINYVKELRAEMDAVKAELKELKGE